MNLLGLDYGTTSLKAALFNEKGEMLHSISYDYTLITDDDFVEFPAEKYYELLVSAIEEMSEKYEISALAIDTQCETLILADSEGNSLCNAIVWLDNRAHKEADYIKECFGNEKVYSVTGQPEITATWPASKLLWIKNNKKDIFDKAEKIFLLEDYLIYKLTGEFVTEKTLQSSSLYFNIKSGKWWQEMLDFIGISENQLPQLYESGVKVGEYKGISVVTSAMDQVAAAIGAGVCKAGTISEMTGTSMVIFAPVNEIPKYNPESIIPCHYNYDGSYAQILWTQTAGMVLKWFKKNFCEDLSFKQLDELAEKIPAGSCGLTMLPHLSGSTMPKYNPFATGVFNGITLEHGRAHFIRSILEAVSCMLKENLDYLPIETKEIRIMGGGASSRLWCQIKADMTGKVLKTLVLSETACLGSAILAGKGIGIFDDISAACESIVETSKVYVPSGEDYKEVYERYISLDRKLNV